MQTKYVEESGRKFAYTHDSRTGSKVIRTSSRAYFLKPSALDKSDPMIKYFVLPDDILEMNDIVKTELGYQEKIVESLMLLKRTDCWLKKNRSFIGDLTRWPTQISSSKQMHMNVWHRLPAGFFAINDQPISIFQTKIFCDFGRNQMKMSHEMCIFWHKVIVGFNFFFGIMII